MNWICYARPWVLRILFVLGFGVLLILSWVLPVFGGGFPELGCVNGTEPWPEDC